MALDDRYANKFAPLDSTAIYPKSSHKLLYTSMKGEMKCPIGYTFALRIPFHLLRCWCNTCTNLDQQMIWSTSYHHITLLVHRSWPHLLFTVAFVHRRQVLLKLHRQTVHRSKASNLPFTLAISAQCWKMGFPTDRGSRTSARSVLQAEARWTDSERRVPAQLRFHKWIHQLYLIEFNSHLL